MKKQYVKPELTGREQLQINEAIAACSITMTGKYQNYDQRRIPMGVFSLDQYGYESENDAYAIREGTGDYGSVGPIYAIEYYDNENVHHTFYWEDFNNNFYYDENYSTYNAMHELHTGVSDNLQTVENTPADVNSLIGPITHLPIRS